MALGAQQQQQQQNNQLQQLMSQNPLLASLGAAGGHIPTSTAGPASLPGLPGGGGDLASMFQMMTQLQFLMNPGAAAAGQGSPPMQSPSAANFMHNQVSSSNL
jgi:hypothetical protein